MAKHFISVLGVGGYKSTVYGCEEGSFETAYIQEAILNLKFNEWSEQDRITIFVTEKSKETNWVLEPISLLQK